MKLWKCQNSTATATCFNQSYIDSYLSNEQLNFVFVNNMFDLDNYDDPISPFIDDQLFFPLRAQTQKKVNLFVSESKASLEDSFFQLGQSTDRNFHMVNTL